MWSLVAPPCQGISLLNKFREGNARKQMWRPFLKVVEQSGAEVFLMENVPQLLGSPEHLQIIEVAESMGFQLAWAKLCAADYGVPQTRFRAFILGCKFADPKQVFPPKKTHFDPKKAALLQNNLFKNEEYVEYPKPWRTVRDAIADLPAPEGTEPRDVSTALNIHFGRSPTEMSIKRYQAIPKEGMNRFDLEKAALEITPDCWKRKKSGGTDLFGRL